MAVQTMEAAGRPTALSRILGNPWKIGGVCGIAFVVLFIVGLSLQGESPVFSDDIADIREFWTDKSDTNQYLIGDWVASVAVILLFLPFIASLRAVLGPADPSGGVLGRLVLIGGALFVAFGAAASMAWGALAVDQSRGLDDSTLQLAMDMDAYAFGTFAPLSIAIIAIPTSLIVLSSGIIWRWTGILGLLLAVVAIASALWAVEGDDESALSFLGFIAFIGLGVWILATSVAMLMKKAGPQS